MLLEKQFILKYKYILYKILTVKLVWSRARDGPRKAPRIILAWFPPGRRRKGRPRNSWIQEISTGMIERGIGDLEWVDREGWRKKINLP